MPLHTAHDTRFVCVLLIVQTFVSFRSVPRILSLLKQAQLCQLSWVPHFTSVINWTQRVGLSLLKAVRPITTPWIAIIDHSIDIGVKKVLVVLRLPLDVIEQKDQAPQLCDCECIGVKISENTTFDVVADHLTEIFDHAGTPHVIVKDQAGNLSKGVGHWRKKKNIKGKAIVFDDIGHVAANALKAEYDKSKEFKRFVELVNKGSARLRQTTLAFLLPPKMRSKGRFHSISKLANWGEMILGEMQQMGRAKEGSVLKKLRQAFPGFTKSKPFLEAFAKSTTVVNQVCKRLKNQGLNQRSYREAKQLLHTLPSNSKVRARLLKWLNRHLAKQSRLGISQTPIMVSSDIIESLFGKFKHVIERSPIADINRMALLIPTLCGCPIDRASLTAALSATSHMELMVWEKQNIGHTLRKKRRAFKNASVTIDRDHIPEFN